MDPFTDFGNRITPPLLLFLLLPILHCPWTNEEETSSSPQIPSIRAGSFLNPALFSGYSPPRSGTETRLDGCELKPETGKTSGRIVSHQFQETIEAVSSPLDYYST